MDQAFYTATGANISLVTAVKNVSYLSAFLISANFVGFQPESLAILIGLMVMDVFTGIVRSAVVNGGASIKSAVGIKGLLAKLLVLTALFSFALAAKEVGFSGTALAEGVVMTFILAETYSILGNVHSALSKSNKIEYDAVSNLMKVAKGLLGKLLDH